MKVYGKRISAFLLAAAMVLSFAACGKSQGGSSGTQTNANGKVFSEPTEISLTISSDPTWPNNENWKLWQYLREVTGATFKVQAIPSEDYATKVNLMMSTPDTLPDLIHITQKPMVDQNANTGALLAFDDNLDKLPNYQAFLNYGYVSSTEAIFYNDPYEADSRLAAELSGSNYRHVVTVNPTLPGCVDSLRRMTQEFPVAGVRILPGFHNYSMQDACLDGLYRFLCEKKFPLFLTLRMEDERACYIFQPQGIPIWDLDRFLSTHREIPIVICNCRDQEIGWLAPILPYQPHVSIDCSGLKNELFGMDKLYKNGLADKLIYGSLALVFCMKSTILLIETADIPESAKADIFSGKRFLNA